MGTIALYSPYIPKHFGGGERYLLSIAEVLSWQYPVSLLVPAALLEAAQEAIPKYEQAFGLHLSKVRVQPTFLGVGKNPFRIAQETSRYDTLFAITDGSIFASFAKKSHLIVQVPWTRSLSLTEKIKLRTWNDILVYSPFVERVIANSWATKRTRVLSPYVDLRDFAWVSTRKKEKIILSTGRFFSHNASNSKRQDVLIAAYKILIDTYHVKGWTLVLVGALEDPAFVAKLKEQARGYHVAFVTNATYDEVRSYNARASIYWHAAGFGVDEKKHPENTEHFGITTLEAMASGAIPFVVPVGGQKDIVGDDRLFWDTPETLAKETASCVTSLSKNEAEWTALSTQMVQKTSAYDKRIFEKAVGELL